MRPLHIAAAARGPAATPEPADYAASVRPPCQILPALLACVLWIGLLAPSVGCARPRAPEAAHPDPEAAVPTPYHLDDLRPADTRTGALLHTLDATWRAATVGWREVPWERAGNEVTERWCGPAVSAAACQGGSVVNDEKRGDAWRSLTTLHYPPRWPEVFGVVVNAGSYPVGSPWGVRAAVSLRGGTISGTSFSGAFVQFDGEKVADRIPFGEWSYRVTDTTFTVAIPAASTPGGDDPAAAAVAAEIERLVASPDSLRETMLARLAALDTEVHRGIAAHEAERLANGTYTGGGVPPVRTPTPLTPEEEAAAAAQATTDIARWQAVVTAQAPALHTLLSACLPPGIWAGG